MMGVEYGVPAMRKLIKTDFVIRSGVIAMMLPDPVVQKPLHIVHGKSLGRVYTSCLERL